jgi:NAD(P)-dependent dehydrogenase (short-subunit alcohol dehydrogenase family)
MDNDLPMRGKICMVTGATAGIGEAAALLLTRQGATVIGVGRNPAKCEHSLDTIIRATGNRSVEYLLADLSSQKDIRSLAETFRSRYDRLDVLVNNAGATFQNRQQSEDGIEMTFALNHLGYFLLTTQLMDALRASDAARVINVSSSLHKLGRIDFDDIPFHKGYSRMKAYWRSKLCNVLFTYELARRLHGTPITANTMNPGLVASNVSTDTGKVAGLMKGMVDKIAGRTPEEGAATIIYMATSSAVAGVAGRFFKDNRSIPSSKVSYSLGIARQLWQVSEELTGGAGDI